ncbi:MAG: SDR family NAD(P)-dependent oxidoreductase, partial [Candidatus Puniceispirillaceae bacterium]
MTDRILITGANRGIGLEMTRQAAAAGHHVTAACRTPEAA